MCDDYVYGDGIKSIPICLDYWLSDKLRFSDLTLNVKNGIGFEIISEESLNVITNSKKNYEELGQTIASLYLDELEKVSFNDLIDKVLTTNNVEVSSSNIPQFSNFDDASIRLLKILRRAGNYGASFDEVGRFLTVSGKKLGAYKKYGENHSKMLNLLDLVYIQKDKCNKVYLSFLGIELEKRENYDELIAKMLIKIPIIREIIVKALGGPINIQDMLLEWLAKTTCERRRTNVRYLINIIRANYKEEKYQSVFDNIK